MTSRVIDHVLEDIDRPGGNKGFAYFYCYRNDEERRQPQSILSSLVRQFASPVGRRGEIHQGARDLAKKLQDECLDMDVQMSKDLLVDLVTSYQSSTIVLDALDECDDDTRGQLMDCLTFLMRQSLNVKIFISSRMDHDIERHFRSQPMIMIQATDNKGDIEAFIRERLASDAAWKDAKLELREEITTTLIDKSKGMFQWAALQVQQILKIKHRDGGAIKKCLDTLPTTLSAAYGQIWEKINQQNPQDRELGRRAIRWVLCAPYPLSTEKLATAMMIDNETENLFDIEEKPTAEVIMGVCYNLLVLDKGLLRWQFCHLSAAEYVESTLMFELQPHYYAAAGCLKYLISRSSQDTSFGIYAREFWQMHVKAQYSSQAEQQLKLKHLLKQFLGSADQSTEAYQTWVDTWMMKDRYSYDLKPSSSPLFGIAALGLWQVLRDWYENDNEPNIDLNLCNEDGKSLLGLAAEYGHFDLCGFLVERGVDIEKGTPSPLHLACRGYSNLPIRALWVDEVNVMKLLIDAGADVGARNGDKTVLDAALYKTNRDAITFLLRHGAKVGDGQWSLVNAASHGRCDLFRSCLGLGADIDGYGTHGDTALIAATRSERIGAVKVLLELGADVNSTSKYRENDSIALGEAARLGRHDMMEILIKAGADPNPKGVDEGPLCRAALASVSLAERKKSIKMLLDAGADINPPHGISPLTSCCGTDKDDLKMVKFLLDAGADPNHAHYSACPLSSAARHNKEALQLLVTAGADPSNKDGRKNCLCIAARNEWQPCLQRLLDIGADPSLTFAQGPGSALACAAFSGNDKSCSFLLKPELGVNVNARLHGWFGNVLLAAMARPSHPSHWYRSWQGKTEEDISEIVSLLFEAGVDILMPIYLTLAPQVPALKLQDQEYLITSLHAPFTFSKHWIRTIWEVNSLPMPHPPLGFVLRRCKLPDSIPLSASVIIKLTSKSEPQVIQYAGLFISPTASARFIFVKDRRRFERFFEPQGTLYVSALEDIPAPGNKSFCRTASFSTATLTCCLVIFLSVLLVQFAFGLDVIL